MVFEKFFEKRIQVPKTGSQELTSKEQGDEEPATIEGVTQEEVEKVRNAYEKHQDCFSKAVLEFREGMESLGLGTLVGVGMFQLMKFIAPETASMIDNPSAYAPAIGIWSVVHYGLKKLLDDNLSDKKFNSLMLGFKNKKEEHGTA